MGVEEKSLNSKTKEQIARVKDLKFSKFCQLKKTTHKPQQ